MSCELPLRVVLHVLSINCSQDRRIKSMKLLVVYSKLSIILIVSRKAYFSAKVASIPIGGCWFQQLAPKSSFNRHDRMYFSKFVH